METINTKAFDELTDAEQNEIDGGTIGEEIDSINEYWDKWKAEFIRGWNRYKG